jgi:small-conductance mechanosensitive channel
MASSPESNPRNAAPTKAFTPIRLISLLVLIGLLVVAIAFYWTTRDAMAHLSSLQGTSQGSTTSENLVDVGPWKTAETLAPMAVSEEENLLAQEAEHLADHEVDQAFAAGLRQAILDAQHRTPSGEALALKQKVDDLQQRLKQDQAQVNKLSSGKNSAKNEADQTLAVAKAQQDLDSDELEDAKHDLDRASGDDTGRVQDELNAHEEEMRKYDAEVAKGEPAVASAVQYGTLAEQISAWLDQRQRYKLILQAHAGALDGAKSISAQHSAIEARLHPAASSPGTTPKSDLETLQNKSVLNEIMSIDDDRIQTQQRLADVYERWSTQLMMEHRSLLHKILGSLLVIVLILITMLTCDLAIRRLMGKLVHDRRQLRTVRGIVSLAVQLLGVALIFLVIFGAPRQTPTILGLTTAALTIALQDYIVAFLGWFRLMGKNGVHVGDWVEINGVGGEVIEFKLMTTTLLETGGLAGQGHPTGRHITFMNSYAIRGQFFNFSTAGQWMWDEIIVSVPAGVDIHGTAQRIEDLAEEETKEHVRSAEREWRQAVRDENLARFSAAPVVSLRPSGAGIELHLRYVTPAEERFDVRNRLYQRVVDLLHSTANARGQ